MTYIEALDIAQEKYDKAVAIAKEEYNKRGNNWQAVQVYDRAIEMARLVYDKALEIARMQYLS